MVGHFGMARRTVAYHPWVARYDIYIYFLSAFPRAAGRQVAFCGNWHQGWKICAQAWLVRPKGSGLGLGSTTQGTVCMLLVLLTI